MLDKPISPLRQRMIDDMTARRFKEKEQKDYVRHVRNFAAFLGRSPDAATSEDVRLFQLQMAKDRVAAPSISAAIAALRFFFNVTLERPDLVRHLKTVQEPRKAPVVLSQEGGGPLFQAAPGVKYRAALSVAYGAGLRVSEVVGLKVTDIDSQRMTIRVEQGKGHRDRYVMLSPQLLELLRNWWRAARPPAWLFPSQNPVNPMTARSSAAPSTPRRGPRESRRRVASYAEALLRHPPARTECRHPRDPGSARPRQAGDHGALHARRRQHTATSQFPGAARRQLASAAARLTAHGPASLEVADIFRAHGPAWRPAKAGHVGLGHLKVMSAIEACRTSALGGHVERCEDCAHVRVAYNSCRNRHCPKCQGAAAKRSLAAREAELLPVPYYHVVFTLPAAIGAIAFQNKAAAYDLLFRAAAETLMTIAADPKHLGARIGFTAVLHTWGSALTHHPHVHFIVPGGGLSPDGSRWIACKPGFFLPVRVLSRLFRRLFLDRLAAPRGRRLVFFGDLAPLADQRLRRRARAAAPRRMGRLRQAPLRRTAVRPRLSRPLHPPRRHLELPAHRARRRGRHLPLEGLPGRRPRPAQDHDARRRRVHPPLSSPRAAERLPPHPPLRPVRRRGSSGQHRARPTIARRSRECAPAFARGRQSS